MDFRRRCPLETSEGQGTAAASVARCSLHVVAQKVGGPRCRIAKVRSGSKSQEGFDFIGEIDGKAL